MKSTRNILLVMAMIFFSFNLLTKTSHTVSVC